MDVHAAMTTFVAVARAGSFAGAARHLGLSTTAVSRHVADLERDLTVSLFRRTTRHVSLTEAGARYLPRAAAILEQVEALRAEIAETGQAPRGLLRLSAPPSVGNDWVAPLIVDFIAAYPEIDVELDITERVVDLVAEGYDAAIRDGPLADSSLIAHRIANIRYRVYASPAYLARRGTPVTPADLAGHDVLHWRGGGAGHAWRFRRDGKVVTAPTHMRLRASHVQAQCAATLRGMGLAVLPELTARGHVEAGRLVQVLRGFDFDYDGPISLVRPAAAFEPAKLRAFIDFITAALRKRAAEPWSG
jgi:DNA-binding transcriptional LysR family regulator